MKLLLSKAWQTILFRGIFAVLFAILAFLWPGITLVSLIYLFAFYAIADGISTIGGAWQQRKTDSSWGLLFFMGIISLLAGILTLFFPGLTAIYLLFFIGFRAIFDGILSIVAAIRLRKEIQNEGLLALSGVISILFGAWVIMRPGQGALAAVWLIAMFALVLGIMLIMLALRARAWLKQHTKTA
ncbi:MAG TPA: HdeD family acid-resistance protein [Puia sp.]|nr:HdeD family acid-resistance protein [Puia sp.]